MKLNELTTPFHKKTMYAYAPDGNTVVLRNVSVRNVNGAIYSGEPETTDYGGTDVKFTCAMMVILPVSLCLVLVLKCLYSH